ncbi:Hsp70 family protein [soil metagenome]
MAMNHRRPAPAPPDSEQPSPMSQPPSSTFCAIDFGTSNSAIAIPDRRPDAAADSMQLVEVEAGYTTMPTAVFHMAEIARRGEPQSYYGRAALDAYIDGLDGRLMRSMKSALGSDLVDQHTDIGGGRSMKYLDVIADYLRHLKVMAERSNNGAPLKQLVLGRPVFFVDGDPARDAKAERSLESAARSVGFQQIAFQYEPIAAAFDYERTTTREQIVLVADIGGGTSDFSVVRVGPERIGRLERKDDILASHGVHVAGTDFDRGLELAKVLPQLCYKARGPVREAGVEPREVPSAVYFDLATWHLINTVYNPQRVAELRSMKGFYGDPVHHQRLMLAINERLGHELASRAEHAKIEVADGGQTSIDLGLVERGLAVVLSEAEATAALQSDVGQIVEAARQAVQRAGLRADQVDALYFTGGSTGLRMLVASIAAAFPAAAAVTGDRFASVAAGLGLYAATLYGPGGVIAEQAAFRPAAKKTSDKGKPKR